MNYSTDSITNIYRTIKSDPVLLAILIIASGTLLTLLVACVFGEITGINCSGIFKKLLLPFRWIFGFVKTLFQQIHKATTRLIENTIKPLLLSVLEIFNDEKSKYKK